MTLLLRSPIALVAGSILFSTTLVGYLAIPAEALLPTHWGVDGTADAFWPRDRALAMAPVVVAVLAALSLAVGRFVPQEELRAGRHIAEVTLPAILALFAAIQTVIVLIGLGVDLSMSRVIAFGLGLLSIAVGNVLPKSQPNGLAGIRLPWTVADNANWRATHRLAGLLMVCAGIALALLALVMSTGPALAVATIAAMLLPIVAATLYSYRLARRI
ncbi:SdpI family protein [Ensifer sp. ZNC0028]|uniref:SdpI family protein n=1 Tax=Ensifer sp. ZNC0028 TaxID=1339236 RepID=UPI0005BA40E5|nr:SdpI family protein [Ensifer sp. ZNC0028]